MKAPKQDDQAERSRKKRGDYTRDRFTRLGEEDVDTVAERILRRRRTSACDARAEKPVGMDESIPREWLEEFEAAARRPLRTRMRYAFIKTHKPVLDDAPYRSFDTMEDYRRWCQDNLPEWLGYGRI
jgi:hypothetical protein